MGKIIVLFSAILADAILVNAAICLGFLTKFHGIPPAVQTVVYYDHFPIVIVILTIIHLVVLGVFQLYRLDHDRFPFEVCYNTFWSVTISWLFSFLVLLAIRTYLLPSVSISRELIFYNWIWTLVLISGWRVLYYRIERNRGTFISRVAIIGTGDVGKEIMQELTEYSKYGHQVLGLIDAEITVADKETELPVLGKISELNRLVDQFKVTELIIAVAGVIPIELLKIIALCETTHTRIKILPSLYEVTVGNITLQETAGIPLIELKSHPITGTYPFIKRLLDVIVSFLSLIVLLPLFIVIAIIIKITSPGPVLFRQERVGKDGMTFILNKFRTMVPNAEANTGPILAAAKDPRITKFGAMLRKTRIDEFLQLFNVLKGDMSLVGPRPERPEFVTKFGELDPFYERRLKIRPGLTGLAQIHGRYDSSVENKLRYDLAYVYNISLMLDLKILFSTIQVVLTRKGAR